MGCKVKRNKLGYVENIEPTGKRGQHSSFISMDSVDKLWEQIKSIPTVTNTFGLQVYKQTLGKTILNKIHPDKVKEESSLPLIFNDDGSPKVYFVTDEGVITDNYQEALQNTGGQTIRLSLLDPKYVSTEDSSAPVFYDMSRESFSMSDQKGVVILGSVSTSQDYFSFEGFANRLIGLGILYPESGVSDGGRVFKPNGSTVQEKTLNLRRIYQDAVHHFGGDNVDIDKQSQTVIIEDESRVMSAPTKLLNNKGEEVEISFDEIVLEANKKGVSELQKEYPNLLDFITNEMLFKYADQSNDITEDVSTDTDLMHTLRKVLSDLGVSVYAIDEYAKKYRVRKGVDLTVEALADASQKVIALSEADTNSLDTMSEEVSHIVLEAYFDQNLITELENSVESTTEWKVWNKHYFVKYSSLYKGTQLQKAVRREILGKILSNKILSKYNNSNSLYRRLINIAVDFFKQIRVRLNNSNKAQVDSIMDTIASKVVEGTISDLVSEEKLDESDLILYKDQKTIEDSKFVQTLLEAKQVLTNRLKILQNSNHWASGAARTDLENLNQQIIFSEGQLQEINAQLAVKSIITSVSNQVSIYNKYLKLKKENKYTLTLADQQDLFYLTTDIRDLVEILNIQLKEEVANNTQSGFSQESLSILQKQLSVISQQIGEIKAQEDNLTKDMNNKMVESYLGEMLLTESQKSEVLGQLKSKQREKHILQKLFGSLEHFGDRYLGVLGKVINDMFFDARKAYSKALAPILSNTYLQKMKIKDFENILEGVKGKRRNTIMSAYDNTLFQEEKEKVKWYSYLERYGLKEEELPFNEFKSNISNYKIFQHQDKSFDKIYYSNLEKFLRENAERYFTKEYYILTDKRNQILGLSDEAILVHKSLNSEIRNIRANIAEYTERNEAPPESLKIALQYAYRRKDEAHFTSTMGDTGVARDLVKLRWFNRIVYSDPSQLRTFLEKSQVEGSDISLHLLQAVTQDSFTKKDINLLQEAKGQVVNLSKNSLDKIEELLTDYRREYKITDTFRETLSNQEDGAFEWLKENGSIALNESFFNKLEGSNREILKYFAYSSPEDLSQKGFDEHEIAPIVQNKELFKGLLSKMERKSEIIKLFQTKNGLFEVDYQSLQARLDLLEEVTALEEDIEEFTTDFRYLFNAAKEVFDYKRADSEIMMSESYYNAVEDSRQSEKEFIFSHTTRTGRKNLEAFQLIINKVMSERRLQPREAKLLEGILKEVGDETDSLKEKLVRYGVDKAFITYGRTKVYSFFKRSVPVGFKEELSRMEKGGASYILNLMDISEDNKTDVQKMFDIKASFDFMELSTEDKFKNDRYIDGWEAGSYQPTTKYINKKYFERYGLDRNNLEHHIELDEVPINNEEYQGRAALLNIRRQINSLHGNEKDSIYRIPQITHHKVERFHKLMQGNILNTLKHSFMDFTSVRQDEKDLGEVLGDTPISELGGRAVPKYYVSELKDPSEVSHDLMYSYTRMLEAAYLYNARQNSLDKISVLKQGLAEERFTNGKKGVDTANYKIFNEFVDAYFYGISINASYKFTIGGREMDLSKMLVNLDNYFRRIRVGASLPIAATGAGASAIYQQVEKYVGEHIGSTSYGWARNEFMRLAPKDIAEVGELRRGSKLRLLGERFGSVDLGNRTMSASYGKIVRSGNGLYYKMMQMADYPISQPTMLAVLDDYRYSEVYGKFINFNFFKSEQALSGASKSQIKESWESLRKDSMYNHLIIKDGVVHFDDMIKDKVSQEQLTALERKVHSKVESMIANLTLNQKQSDRPMAHRHSVLRGALSFRSWLLIMLQRRFKGGSFNWQTEASEVGHYRTAFNLIWKPITDSISNRDFHNMYKSIRENWAGLSDVEKKNTKRVLIESGILAGLLLVGRALADYVDDEDERDKWGLQMLAFVGFRTINEFASISPIGFTNVGDIGQAPFMAISSANQFLDWRNYRLNEIKAPSPYEGHSKLYKLIMSNTIANQYYRLKNPWMQHKTYRFHNQETLPLLEYTPESKDTEE